MARAVDGDSLVLADRRIRLKDIDAPEGDQRCVRDGQTYGCGQQATSVLQSMVSSAPVACSGGEQDRYGRLLAYCSAGGEDINAAMVRRGWAVASGGYRAEEAMAQREEAGLWQGDFEHPRDWRARRGMAVDIGPANMLIRFVRDAQRFLGFADGDKQE